MVCRRVAAGALRCSDPGCQRRRRHEAGATPTARCPVAFCIMTPMLPDRSAPGPAPQGSAVQARGTTGANVFSARHLGSEGGLFRAKLFVAPAAMKTGASKTPVDARETRVFRNAPASAQTVSGPGCSTGPGPIAEAGPRSAHHPLAACRSSCGRKMPLRASTTRGTSRPPARRTARVSDRCRRRSAVPARRPVSWVDPPGRMPPWRRRSA